jgi:hypothetical protein
VWARNPTTSLSRSQTRWMPCWAWSATSAMVSPAQLASAPPFQVGPQVFDRVELGRVGRQPFDLEPVSLLMQVGAHLVAPVGRQAIPQQHHPLPAIEAGQLLQHADQAVGVVGVLLQVKAQPSAGNSAGRIQSVAEGGGLEARFQATRWRRIGVWPRGDQLRRTGGISEMPDSSKKTSQADSARALF